MIELSHIIEATGEEHDLDIVSYGFSVLMDGIVTAGIIIFLGIVTKRLMNSLIYLISSVCGTATMGGYHCNTRKRCLSLTIALWMVTMYMDSISRYFLFFPRYVIIVILMFTLVYLYAPVVHENKTVSETVWRKNRRTAIWIEIGVTILIIILRFFDWNLVGSFLVNKVEVVILMLMGRRERIYAERKKCKTACKIG